MKIWSHTESMSEVASVEATLWDAANQLRPNLDAAECKHVVLGLIFLEYGSDVFNRRERELAVLVDDDTSDYYMPTPEAKQPNRTANRGTYRPGVRRTSGKNLDVQGEGDDVSGISGWGLRGVALGYTQRPHLCGKYS